MGVTRTASRGFRRRAGLELATLIDRREFTTVFQPVVQVDTLEVVGFEALTRFRNGASPERVFAAATRCGLGPRLEAAAMEFALIGAAHLPRGTWVSLNISPEALSMGPPLRDVLAGADRPIVLELTEHEEVVDYDALRSTLDDLQGIRLAIDDAGAGFASLRHVLELHPAFVKADRFWMRGLAHDPCRHTIVAGLHALAGSIGAHLIAEGVEHYRDLKVLRALGVPFAQGFLLGRPASALAFT
jgi:EAL domain-containing protein (putative c-di-GMP-specific phosphodiesterase class I)